MMCMLLISGSYSQPLPGPRDIFYRELNQFRSSPRVYANQRGYQIACSDAVLDTYPQLSESALLETASDFHASTLASTDCQDISHDTCEKYSYMFNNSRAYVDRIGSFLRTETFYNIEEILIKGTRNPLRAMSLFLASPGHCNRLVDKFINSMGASFVHDAKSIIVVDFAYVDNVCSVSQLF